MKVLLSIKPEYAEKILDGRKRFEFRKAMPRIQGVKTVVIYATMPVGKVVGEFEIDECISCRPRELWAIASEFSGISRAFFNSYFKGRATAHAFKVASAKRYEFPLDLIDLIGTTAAPQSFRYLA
ncbi:ASCH domain-containing protein [Stenotrophomonas tuberculopleuritidis]|uniref:ASCH domain-containing protein n=1 Tax=Stenotrophomonas tuberculopleuritidis TaxID=3055079 RepID=UPI0026E54DB1|nr:ASCH domain-containing protein [Stenotrophomonas sp. 704A1]